MNFEGIKSMARDAGKKLLDGALALVKTTAATTLELAGKAAGKAVGYAKNKAGSALHKTGAKVQEKASEQGGTLLLLGFVFAALALLMFLLRAYGRRRD